MRRRWSRGIVAVAGVGGGSGGVDSSSLFVYFLDGFMDKYG